MDVYRRSGIVETTARPAEFPFHVRAAIGGIAARNGAALIEAGADVLAAIDGDFGAEDVEHAARDYAALFS